MKDLQQEHAESSTSILVRDGQPAEVAAIEQRRSGWRIWRSSSPPTIWCAIWHTALTAAQAQAGWRQTTVAEDLAELEARLTEQPNTLEPGEAPCPS